MSPVGAFCPAQWAGSQVAFSVQVPTLGKEWSVRPLSLGIGGGGLAWIQSPRAWRSLPTPLQNPHPVQGPVALGKHREALGEG